jgi:hypothetical protein
MEYFTTAGAASRRAVDCVIVGVYERGKLGAGAADIDSASDGSIKRHLKNGDVSGRLGRCSVLTDVKGVRIRPGELSPSSCESTADDIAKQMPADSQLPDA